MSKLGIAGNTMEADPTTVEDVTARDREIAQFMGTATEAIDELRRRIEKLESEP